VVREAVLVDDHRAALLDGSELGDQRGRVHRDQHVGVVARREDVARGEVDLEGGHAVRRSGGRADLGGEVRQRREIVADHRGGVGETAPRELHAVTGVARKPHDDAVNLLESLVFHYCSEPTTSVDLPAARLVALHGRR
jgi:hypothetical protein